ncbi:hypothetical protein DFH06DRAFT_1331756 [Mycena polygramma]|nr:hypothetical protein DFH06DRAFT_1331756 [Mycena polygramma]
MFIDAAFGDRSPRLLLMKADSIGYNGGERLSPVVASPPGSAGCLSAILHSRRLPRYGIEHGGLPLSLVLLGAPFAIGPEPTQLSCYAPRRAPTTLGVADKYDGVVEADGTLTMTEVLDEEDAPSKPSSISVSIHRLPCPRRLRRRYLHPPFQQALSRATTRTLRSSTRRSSENTVAEYMQSLEEKGDKRFKKQFATYLADGVGKFKVGGYAADAEDDNE